MKTLAAILLVLSCCAPAQTSPKAECTQQERTAAKDVARSFLDEMREKRNVASLRPRYLSQSCMPLFDELVEVSPSVRAASACDETRGYGEASFDWFFILTELMLSSGISNISPEDPLASLPKEIADRFKTSPTLNSLWNDGKQKIVSRARLEKLVTDLETSTKAAREYINDHPEVLRRAAEQSEKLQKEAGVDGGWTDCTTSDGMGLKDLPEGTPVVVRAESLFVFVLVRENGEFKIARILPLSE